MPLRFHQITYTLSWLSCEWTLCLQLRCAAKLRPTLLWGTSGLLPAKAGTWRNWPESKERVHQSSRTRRQSKRALSGQSQMLLITRGSGRLCNSRPHFQPRVGRSSCLQAFKRQAEAQNQNPPLPFRANAPKTTANY